MTTTTVKPQKGDEVEVTYKGVVEPFGPGSLGSLMAGPNHVRLRHPDGKYSTHTDHHALKVTRHSPPEVGKVYQDKDGDIAIRRSDGRWYLLDGSGDIERDSYMVRPLKLISPE